MSELSKNLEEMQDLLYDPMLVQDKVLNMLDDASDGVINIPDPNNPFMYLLETNILPMASAMGEVTQAIRNIHPILAQTKEQLYPHLIDSDLEDTYATASKATFTFYINKKQILSNGYQSTNSVEITIPKSSTISVNDIDFTMLNDINISIFKNNSVFVKLIGNNDMGALKNNVLIPAGIVSDVNKVEWLIFETEIDQLKLISLTDSIIKSNKYSKEVLISKQFSHIEISSIINNTYVNLNISYSNFVYTNDAITAYVQKLEDRIKIEIPYYYIVNNMIGDELSIKVYTTNGDIVEPMSNYTAEETILKFNISDSQNPRVTSINNLSIFAKPTSYTYGGRDELDFEALKAKIINNTTGENILPITEHDVKEELSKEGFKLVSKNDSVFNREFLVHKYLDSNYSTIDAKIDVFMDTVQIDNTNVDDYYVISNSDYLIINPFSIFSYDGKSLRMVAKTVMDSITTLSKDNVSEYLNDNRLFYNIYKYVLDHKENINCRIYDVNTPNVTNVRDNVTNSNIETNMTVTSRVVSRIADTYTIKITIVGDSTYTNMDLSKIKGQLALGHEDTLAKVYVTSDIVAEDNVYTCTLNIDTTGYIDEIDRIFLKNYEGDIGLANVNLSLDIDFSIYTTDLTIADKKTFMVDDIYDTEKSCDIYKETFTFTFGKRITFLYDKYTIDYTNRKYLKYEEVVYLTYTENIYLMDENGVVVNYVDTTGDGEADTAQPVIIHAKGEDVLDDEGNKIVLHNVGDIILDNTGGPTIDTAHGMIHNADVLLLEYEYKLVTNSTYRDYIIDSYTNITDTCTSVLKTINDKLLDNTVLKYKPLSILKNVNTLVNKLVYNNPNFVVPVITAYVSEVITDNKVYTLLKTTLSSVLQDGLRDELPMSTIIDNMLEYSDITLLSVTISDIDIVDDVNIKVYADDSSRFVIDKNLILDSEGNISIELNTKLNVLTI